jgi:hypothetical protein
MGKAGRSPAHVAPSHRFRHKYRRATLRSFNSGRAKLATSRDATGSEEEARDEKEGWDRVEMVENAMPDHPERWRSGIWDRLTVSP